MFARVLRLCASHPISTGLFKVANLTEAIAHFRKRVELGCNSSVPMALVIVLKVKRSPLIGPNFLGTTPDRLAF
jgi:hypothetical protein